jgi:hypothetical protein
MSTEILASGSELLLRFVHAISSVDCDALRALATNTIQIDIPGARFVDITESSTGPEALCTWARRVSGECGRTNFDLYRYFENGSELMATGRIRIERLPRTFESPCSIHVVFEMSKVASFQLLLDTFALQKFRGQLD